MSVATGLVKYELRPWGYINQQNGRSWNYKESFDGFRVQPMGDVQGTVLMQMLDARRLKIEIFPGKGANEVQGFTAKAAVYER